MKIPSLLAPLAPLFRLVAALLTGLFGRLAWQPPAWLVWLARRPLTGAALLVVLAAGGGGGWYGYQWYSQRPQPHTVDYRVEPPARTEYDKTPPVISPLRVRFAESIAPLALIGKPVVAGVRLEPAHTGGWRWLDDRTLEFTPAADWPVGGSFTLAFAKRDLFAADVLLNSYQTTFSTAPFTARFAASEFHQDPGDPNLKKIVATVDFSHPVDERSLRPAVRLSLGEGLAFRDRGKEPWTLTVDKDGLHAHIHSAPLAMPLEPVPAILTLAEGIGSAKGGGRTTAPVEQKIVVPGRSQLTFTNPTLRYIANQQGEPEQVLLFESSFAVADEVIGRHVRAWLLPEKEDGWDIGRLAEADLQRSQTVELRQIPGAEPLNSQHSFALRVPVKRQLFVRIDAEVEAVGGYVAKKETAVLIPTGEYPKVLRLLGDGALLSLNGEQRIGFMAQGMAGMKVEIARLLPGQLHQIIDQNYDRFAQPSVYGEQFDRLVERQEYVRTFPPLDPAKPLYDSIDLHSYLTAGGGRRGVFVLRLTPFDPAQPHRSYSDYLQRPEHGDRRFILVTDLGLISKRTLDGGQEVFVQSIATGTPVAGARVEVLGRNGLPVAEARTDASGHARFPQMHELRREKHPIMLTASLGDDLSFLPLGRGEHQVDFSRFDIGGAVNERSPDEISAALFTDRGLYRPGETAHIALILRAADWSPRIEGMPVEIEITDPRGLTVWNQRRACPQTGLDSIDFSVGQMAPTGTYGVSVYLVKNSRRAALLGFTEFRVREFEPDRMKVDLRLTDAPTVGWARPEAIRPLVKARHLFGADASDRRVTGRMELAPALPSFTQYPGLRFHLDSVLKEGVGEDLAETTTSAAGEAVLAPDLERFARSAFRLRLTARVYEAEGGRNVVAEEEVLVSAAPYLVGVGSDDSLDGVPKGANRTSRWLAVGPDLHPVTADNLRLVLIEHRFVSVLVKQPSGVYKYESRRKDLVRDERLFTLPGEGISLALPTDEPGDFSYELRDEAGTVCNRIGWSVAGASNLSRPLDRNALLQVKLDKTNYAPGETIRISVRAPYTGSGLITIERDRVYAHAWFKSDTTSSVQTITVPKDLEGNGYVNVQFVRDPNSPEIFMSPLSSGVAPFGVALDARRLPLTLQAPEHIEPGRELAMTCTPGETAKAVVFAVDEGILQVARYKTPDPLGHFFQKRSLEVQTAQILSLILPEFSHLLAAAAPGGGGEEEIGAHLNPFKRKRQGPVVYWSGVVDLPAGGRTFRYTVPEGFNGRLRLMAVAVTRDRIGVFEARTEVRGPWVLTPNIPAFVAPGDEFTVSVGAFSNLPAAETVTLRLHTGEGLTILGDDRQPLEVAPGREGVALFRLRGEERLGSVDLVFHADSPGGTARLGDALSIRPATPHRVALRVGQFREAAFSLARQRDLHDEHRRVELGFGHSPLVWSQGLTAYLDQYPYACTEQLLSKAMPPLIAASAEDIRRADFPPLQAAFTLLRQRQNEAGGFGQWASNLSVQPEISVYAADFLIEAKERGAPVPADLDRSSRAYLERIAQGPAEGLAELRTKTRAIYLLTRQGVVTSGPLAAAIEQLDRHHRQTWRADLAAAYLAASQALLKKAGEADSLIGGVGWRSLASGLDAPPRWFSLYDDALSHDAELLGLMARHFPDRLAKIPANLLPALGERVSGQHYHSLSAALLIRAFDLYGRSAAVRSGPLTVEAGFADGSVRPLDLKGPLQPIGVPQGWDKLILRKEDGGLPSFYQVTEAGFDRHPPETILRQGIDIVRAYVDKDGQPLDRVRVGDTFTVRLTLRAGERDTGAEVAIVDLLPGGVEPVVEPTAEEQEEVIEAEEDAGDRGIDRPEPIMPLWEPTFVDTRDDRVVVYAFLSRDAATYEYRVRATNAGTFRTPPPYAEGMYEPGLQGRGEAGTLTIVEP